MALGAALAVLLLLPLTSLGSGAVKVPLRISRATIGRVLPQLARTVEGSVQPAVRAVASTASSVTARTQRHEPQSDAAPAADPSSGAGTEPAMYGTNPHGQGTVGAVQLNPSSHYPYPYDPSGKNDGEVLVVGRGRSEQNPNGYHAHTTIAALLGMELLGVDAPQGQSNAGPLNAVQTGILDAICKSTSQMVCLTVLAADTAASASGATTHFSVLHATVGGSHGLDTGVAESDSAIQTTGSCQTSSGSSQAANVALAGGQVAGVAKSSESSTACTGQTPVQKASSSVISLGGTGVALPAAGCANGTPNTESGIPPLLPIICNADSANTQADPPSGVREALTVIAIQSASSVLLKSIVAASESHAVAPPVTTPQCTDADHDCGNGPPLTPKCIGYPADTFDNDGDCDTGNRSIGGKKTHKQCPDSDHDCGKGPPGTGTCTNDSIDNDGDCVLPGGGSETGIVSGARATRAVALRSTRASTLPFTGEDVLKVLLIGLLLTGGGLALGARTKRT
jgi:hypothetical protein